MWQQITTADLERAKAAWRAMREKILARHQEELKILEADGNLLRGLETGLMAFHQRFIAGGSNLNAESISAAVCDSQPSEGTERVTEANAMVVALPVSPRTEEQSADAENDRGPNFLDRMRS